MARKPRQTSPERPVPLLGFGRREALLCIDLMAAYTTPGSPLYAEGVVAAVRRLPPVLLAARAAGVPVIHTRVDYDPTCLDQGFPAEGGMWIRKAPTLARLRPGIALTRFDPRAAPTPGELVVTKKYSGAFASTSLDATLRGLGVDTVVMVGCTTSGCVRASAMEALQRGFRPLVIRDCVGDRHPDPHAANLADLESAWADVVSRQAVLDRWTSAR